MLKLAYEVDRGSSTAQDLPEIEQKVFGLRVSAMTELALIHRIDHAIQRECRINIASLNLHGIYTFYTDQVFRKLHLDAQTLVRIDGMSIIMLARLAGIRLRGEHRVAWIDLLPHILDQAAISRWRVFYLGGKADCLETGLKVLRSRYPTIEIDGCHGYFRIEESSVENERVLARINAWHPDILLVGMGMGRQERWVMENRDRVDVPVVSVCGACIEYFAGDVKVAPRWLGPLGLEWAFRLLSDPRRFGWRYLIEPWLAMALLVRTNLRVRAKPQ